MGSKRDPMVAMSEGIREVLERYAPTIADLSNEELDCFTIMIAAYNADLRAEQKRRSA